jgi:hypothetical protein
MGNQGMRGISGRQANGTPADWRDAGPPVSQRRENLPARAVFFNGLHTKKIHGLFRICEEQARMSLENPRLPSA